LTLKYIEPDSSIIDVGSGNGRVLVYINDRKKMKELIAADVSEDALNMAQENGIKIFHADISDLEQLKKLPKADYVLMFEILEHLLNSEEILSWAIGNSAKGVFFSVPNTGFIFHRLRLLLGRFPLQWRLKPSEHVRFWTARDMRWWLRELGFKNYILKLYEGAPFLNKIWPSLFGQGIWVFISTSEEGVNNSDCTQRPSKVESKGLIPFISV